MGVVEQPKKKNSKGAEQSQWIGPQQGGNIRSRKDPLEVYNTCMDNIGRRKESIIKF
jgi:hypothetical protein